MEYSLHLPPLLSKFMVKHDKKAEIMVQKKFFFATLAAMLLAVPVMGQSNKGKSLEVSFNYQKQAGAGSNQYAVWIENDKEECVKTLFVTSFTTKGRARGNAPAQRGYVIRPTCVPAWVQTSKAASKSDLQLDAVTGATPQSDGKQTFTWNFKDEQGKAVPKGTYKVKVEATLYFESDIIYTGTFSTQGKPGAITLTSELTKPDEAHKNMITDVKAVLK